MTKLYLIRHAEAEGNLYRRIHGHYDSVLTENGYRQITALRERFASTPIDAVYSSDLFRARITANAICDLKKLPLETRSDLREINLGVWEDRAWGEVDMNEHESMRLFCDSSSHWRVDGGETFEQLRSRAATALLEIAARHPGQSVAVISHGTAIRYACASFLGLTVEESRTMGHSDNTAVTLLEVEDGKVRIAFSDDNSHLSQEISTLAQQGWWKNKSGSSPDENLWYQAMDLTQMAYRGLYLSSRQEAWVDLGRDIGLFGRQMYLERAEAGWKQNPQNLVCTQRRNTIVGILQLDPERYRQEQAGYISFFYMLPEHRGNGLGVQMVGQAVSTYRPMGFEKLRLTCGADNVGALRFYERHGFSVIDSWKEPFGAVHLMEKYIGYKPMENLL